MLLLFLFNYPFINTEITDTQAAGFTSVAPPYTICDVEHLFGVDGRVVLGNSSTCGRNAHNNRLPEFAAGYMVGVGGVDTGVLANPPPALSTRKQAVEP